MLAFEQQKHEREKNELLSGWTLERESKCKERAVLRRRKQIEGEEMIANNVLVQDRREQLKRLLEEEAREMQEELASVGLGFYTERI